MAPGTPAAPTASANCQPTCAVPTGTITVTAPTGAGLTYSIDGTTYTNQRTFTLVAPGTYDVTVKDAGGCISAATQVIVNGAPGAPAAPTLLHTATNLCRTNRNNHCNCTNRERVLLTASMEQIIKLPHNI